MLPLAGAWTLDSFSRHLGGLDLFGGAEPGCRPSATTAAGRSSRRPPTSRCARPAARSPTCSGASRGRSRSSSRCGSASRRALEPVTRRLAAYPGLRFKLDSPDWDDGFARALAGTGAVASIDFKGAYKGTPVDVATDPALYRRFAEDVPRGVARGPRPHGPEADAALARTATGSPGTRRSTASPTSRRCPSCRATINVKPSRIGSWRELLRPTSGAPSADHLLRRRPVRSSASAAGRSSTSRRSSTRDEPNDIAPSGYDWADFPADRACRRPAAAGPRADRVPPARVDSSGHGEAATGQDGAEGALAAMQRLESRSDEELEAETRYKAAAQAILGARAAERMDAKRAREHFRVAIAAARPQERPAAAAHGRGLAGARRAPRGRPQGRRGEARADAADEPPAARAARDGRSSRRRQRGHPARRIGGSCSLLARSWCAIALGFGIVKLIALPFGGIGTGGLVLLGLPARLRRARRADLLRPAPGQARAGAQAAEQRAAQFKR